VLIRRETHADIEAVRAVHTAAFADPEGPPGRTPAEAWLVDTLRADSGWIPALSLVAVGTGGEIAGHVVCTRARVGRAEALGLGPLGVLPGRVVRFPEGDVSVPHMGWNALHPFGDAPLLAGVADGAHVYFAHSYVVAFDDAAAFPAGATTTYGATRFLSAVSRGALHATQFHPEKSQRVGLRILANFADAARAAWTVRG